MTPKDIKNDDKFLMNISRKLKAARKVSQEELAELADISVDTISNIERGRFMPSLKTFVKLCNALELSPNEILEDYIIKNKR